MVQEARGFAGVGAEIAARVQERAFRWLQAPVLRVAGLDIPYPPRPSSSTSICPASNVSLTRSRSCNGTTVPHECPHRLRHRQNRPGEIIRRADVEAALQVGEVGSLSHKVTPTHGAGRADLAGDMRIPLRGVRKAIADKLTTSRCEIPEANTWVDVDATALLAARDEIKAVNSCAGIGLMALFARISVAVLKKGLSALLTTPCSGGG